MPGTERVTLTLPADLADAVRGAVETGDYASASAVVQDALRDWTLRRAAHTPERAALEADIAHGLADVAAGRVRTFDGARIIGQGRRLSAARSRSA